MRYMILIYGDPNVYAQMSQDTQQEEFASYMAFNQEAGERGVLTFAGQLQPATLATTVRIRDGKTLTTDGPYAETKEHLGGFYVLDCKDLDEAIALAAKLPVAKHGSVEIRPVMEQYQ